MIEELKNIVQFADDRGYFVEYNSSYSVDYLLQLLDNLEKTLNHLNSIIVELE